MTIAEVTGQDPQKAELDRIRKQAIALRQRKARIKADQAQQRLRDAQARK